ncbi:hypothetical protein PsorP6_012340 [Peronosclerospora sorghi]|uniref:Uncharacterized protein n=1 Tax=Peronosclerospora sorghi TaxID=230839 RepID=A0ACC0WHE5_9STRA|nr:hypothetical protein PsorP6_012340 [Peronosclerospora sorghi]
MRSDESDYGAATLSKKLIQHIDVSSVLTAYAAATDAKTQDRGNLDLSRYIFEPESSNYLAERDVLAQNTVYSLFARSKCRLRVSRNRGKFGPYYLANMLDDRGLLIEDVEGAEKFITLLYWRLLAEDRAISTTESQDRDRSCLVDVSCDVGQSDIRFLVLKVKTGMINDGH